LFRWRYYYVHGTAGGGVKKLTPPVVVSGADWVGLSLSGLHTVIGLKIPETLINHLFY